MTAPERVPLTPTSAAVDGHPTTAAGAGTLADAIARWHAAHPDFVRVLECAEPAAVVLPIVPRGMLIAAARLGISVAELYRRRGDGERWCSWGQHFAPDWWVDGRRTQAYCHEHQQPYQREAARLRRERTRRAS